MRATIATATRTTLQTGVNVEKIVNEYEMLVTSADLALLFYTVIS